MSIWSARYHNSNAHIVLLTDDQTDKLLTGKRAELLDYVSEKIVVPFDNDTISVKYRSRWIKTSVRQLIEGDFLYIDCDTIVCRSLDSVDAFDCEVGAVWESHLLVEDFCHDLLQSAVEANKCIGLDLNNEKEYFSSGVLYVKDNSMTHQVYDLWHKYWEESYQLGLPIDQPALAKANRDLGHIIKQIPDTYNCILFTRPPFVREAHILHIAAYQNPSFLFADKVLNYVKENGIENKWLKNMILNPCATMMPFDYNLKHSSCMDRRCWKKELVGAWKGYGENIDRSFVVSPYMRLTQRDIILMKYGMVGLAMWLHLLEYRIRLMRKNVKQNTCQK